MTYGNIAWCNTWMAKLKTIFSKQEQVTTSISSDYKNLKSQKTMENLGIKYIPDSKSNVEKEKYYHTRSISDKTSISAIELHDKTQRK